MGNVEREVEHVKRVTSIEGTLLMLDDKTPHVAVPVQAICDGEVIATTLSDESGRYRFINLEPGQYQLRCQVLGGYVYYKATDHALRFTFYDPDTTESAMEDYSGDTLDVPRGKTLRNVDFRFAPFKKGTWKHYGPFEGLAHDTVDCICVQSDGIMWFGTDSGGVSRYDGKEFTNFTYRDGLGSDDIWAIYRDPDGIMWFGTFGGGISRYDGKEFITFTSEDGLAGDSVFAIHRDPDGVMWFGGWRGAGVSRYDGRQFVNFTTEDGLASDSVHAIHRDPDGVMWFATANGISRYDGKEFVNFTTKDGLAGNFVWTIHRDPDGVLWFGTYGGVSQYDGKQFANFTVEDGLASDNVIAIESGTDGALWFGTGGIFTTQTGRGVSRYDGERFITFTTEDGLADDHISSIYCDPDGVMWFGTCGSGISQYDGKQFANFTPEDGLRGARYSWRSNWVVSAYRGPDGAMWFGTWYGVSRYDGKEFVNYTEEDGLAGGLVGAICHDKDGILWFGTWGRGVSRYDGKTFATFSIEDGLAGNIIHSIYCDSDGILWFGTDSKGVSGYDGTAWTSLDTRDGLAGNKVNSICQDPDGFLWFGTNGGLTRYRRSIASPKVRIASIITDQTYRLKTEDSGIPAFNVGARITIEYYALDFKTIPEKRQYRCRVYKTQDSRHKTQDEELRTGDSLESGVLSPESSEAYNSPTKETSFDWIPEKPGTYVFEVQAIDRDLNYSEPASVMLEVIPDPRNHRIIQLEEHIRQQELAEMERIHRELEDARRIQQSLLPEEPPKVKGFEIADTSLPAREVSGDFYDYLPLGDNIGIVLADVTGKSVKAAMVAALADGMLSEETKRGRELWNSPGMILRELNMGLQTRLVRGMFTAMSLCIIHAGGKQLVFSNAGMPYPIVKHGSEVRELEVNGIPLGLMEEAEYEDLSADLEGGDFVVFYSDGIIEAENEAGEMYQTERVLELIQNADPGLSAQEMVDLVVKDVTEFTGDEELSDDITIVVLQCEGC